MHDLACKNREGYNSRIEMPGMKLNNELVKIFARQSHASYSRRFINDLRPKHALNLRKIDHKYMRISSQIVFNTVIYKESLIK